MTVLAVYIRIAAGGAQSRVRAPELERLLTHASAPALTADWRCDAFGVLSEAIAPPAVAAAALYASSAAVPGQWVCVASPVHLVAGMTDVTLSAGGVLQLDPAESVLLAADFNRVFSDSGARLAAGRNGVLLCVFDRVLEVDTHDPLDVVGRDVFGLQPAGADAARLRLLMSEMELWLFEHEVNRTRTARDWSVITGLWLWGGGVILSALPDVRGWTAGTDPLFAAFGDASEFPRAGPARGGVLVCDVAPGSEDWLEVDERWLVPLSAALRAGEIERAIVSVAGRTVSVEKGRRCQFWRRPRPWWEVFGLARVELAQDTTQGNN